MLLYCFSSWQVFWKKWKRFLSGCFPVFIAYCSFFSDILFSIYCKSSDTKEIDKPVCHVLICFYSAHSSRQSGYNGKLKAQRKHWECWEMLLLWCSQSVRVITHCAEENQEGTLCRPDKQAVCLRTQRSHEHSSRPALPSDRPQSSAVLSLLPEICLHVWATRPKQKESWREWGAEADWRTALNVNHLCGREVWLHTNRCRLVTLQGCRRRAPLDHEVCSPHGSSGEWFVSTLWALS